MQPPRGLLEPLPLAGKSQSQLRSSCGGEGSSKGGGLEEEGRDALVERRLRETLRQREGLVTPHPHQPPRPPPEEPEKQDREASSPRHLNHPNDDQPAAAAPSTQGKRREACQRSGMDSGLAERILSRVMNRLAPPWHRHPDLPPTPSGGAWESPGLLVVHAIVAVVECCGVNPWGPFLNGDAVSALLVS